MDEIRDLHELCEILMQNIKEVKDEIRGRRLEPEEAEYLDYLLHSLKSVKCVIQILERDKDGKTQYADGGYSSGEYRAYMDGSTYGRRMRDSRGRYMESGYGRMYRDDGKDQVMDHLRSAMDKCQDQGSRKILEDAMHKFEGM